MKSKKDKLILTDIERAIVLDMFGYDNEISQIIERYESEALLCSELNVSIKQSIVSKNKRLISNLVIGLSNSLLTVESNDSGHDKTGSEYSVTRTPVGSIN